MMRVFKVISTITLGPNRGPLKHVVDYAFLVVGSI